MPEFYSGATDRLGCLTEGFCLRRLHLACVLVFATWLVDLFIHSLSGDREILIYGVLPLDVAMISLFGAYGVIEAARALRSDE